MPHSFSVLKSSTNELNRSDSMPYHGVQTVISNPFNASAGTSNMLAASTTGSAVGVFPALCVADAAAVAMAVTFASLQAVKMKDMIRKQRNILVQNGVSISAPQRFSLKFWKREKADLCR